MTQRGAGFSFIEVLVVVVIMGIVMAFAIPQAYTAIKEYRVHSDASALSAQLNVARFRATSQDTPYRVHIDTTTNTFYMERLTTAYASFSPPQIEFGTQYLSTNDAFTTTNPGGANCPPPAPLSFTSCSGATDFYFNTRGLPVDSGGNPIGNGGEVIYVQGATGFSDAVTVSVGGLINAYTWETTASKWLVR